MAAEDADSLRNQGTEKFKAEKYQESIDLYTRSLELNPTDHRCYSNRCAAYCKLRKNFDKALEDAQKCVEVKPDWPKGYMRILECLKFTKRIEEAKPWLERGLENVSAEDKPSIEKALKEVMDEIPRQKFLSELRGSWNGTVNEVLGGYDQEMEFLEGDEQVRVNVLGRSIVGRFWVDVTKEPHHLNIQVPHGEVGAHMPPPPPVPYIARIDPVGLHLCCPYLKMERPTEFTGPGYVLMKRGTLEQPDASEVSHLSRKEKLIKCTQDILKALPSRKLEEVGPSDSEDAAGEKLMLHVRFESSMYTIQRQFGEDMVKEILTSIKESKTPPELVGIPELEQLAEKMKTCGLLEDEPPAPAAKPSSSSSSKETAPSKTAESSSKTEAATTSSRQDGSTGADEASSSSGSSSCLLLGGSVAIAVAAAAAFVFTKQKR